jgi:uncharacterized repeat protein (TIGR03943 family)
MNRQVQAVVMLLLGGAIVKASTSDMYLRYVKAGLRPFLIVAGLLLIAAAVMTLWYELRGAAGPAPADGSPGHHDHDAELDDHHAQGHEQEQGHGRGDDGHGDDGHGHHEPQVGWLLILPVLALLLIGPPALGAYAAGQAGSVLTAQNSASDFPALPAGDPARLTLLDYASRAVFDQGKTFTGRTIELTGFVTEGPDGRPLLARIVLACCAADGRPVKVGLDGTFPTTVPVNTWVTVVGTYDPKTGKDPVNGAAVPYLQVTSWHQIPLPDQQYE